MTVKTLSYTLTADLATSGTVSISYPPGTNIGWFVNGVKHYITAAGGSFTSPNDFGITTWGATTFTVTWRNATTIPSGTTIRVGLDSPGVNSYRDLPPAPADVVSRNTQMFLRRITLGSPTTSATSAICTVLPASASGTASIAGSVATGGVAVLDVPRNVTYTAFTGGALAGSIKITGKDVFNQTIIEDIPSQTTTTLAQGAKAFKSVTSVQMSFSSALAGTQLSGVVGFGNVLGLPVFLPNSALILKELEDGAAATTGTTVAGLSPATASTSSTADVRGTYVPNTTANAVKCFELVLALSDPTHTGNPQYAG